jgi:hypothetical protein
VVASNWPVVRRGDRHERVRSLQYLLREHGRNVSVDAAFGPQTEEAVRSWQSERGLAADGVVGPQTWPTLVVQVQSGSRGEAVRAVQSQLRFRGASISADGDFGPITEEHVRRFQRNNDLAQDGIVGPQTWRELVGSGTLMAQGPEEAARHLYEAWLMSDQDSAAQAATPEAVDALFAFSPPDRPDRFEFTGCEASHDDAGGDICFFYQEGDGMNMRVAGGLAIGFVVTEVGFVAD